MGLLVTALKEEIHFTLILIYVLKIDPHGEDVLLAQGLDQLSNKLGFSIFEEEKGSPVNVDDDDWLMRDLSGNFSLNVLCFETK